MNDDTLLSRRKFLGKAAAAAASAVMLADTQETAAAPRTIGKDALALLDKETLIDQDGKRFDSKAVLGGKPFILVFGFNECQQCQKISNTLSKVHEQLKEKKLDIPVVVVNIHPDQDRKNIEEYLEHYAQLDIVPYAEGTPETERALDKRRLHVLFPPSKAVADKIQGKGLQLIYDPWHPDGHATDLLVCDQKGVVTFNHAADVETGEKTQEEAVKRTVAAVTKLMQGQAK